MRPNFYDLSRPGNYVPPMLFLGLGLLCLLNAPNVGAFIFYLVLSILCSLWLWRGFRVRVELSEGGLMIRTVWRTTRLRWNVIDHAELRPMRTASPFKRIRSYPALALQLSDGTSRQFDDVSAPPEDRVRISNIADQINGWLHGPAA